MPVLIVYGMPSDVGRDNLEPLLVKLQIAGSFLLGLSSNEVSVFFPADIVQRRLGEELVCVVEGLFEKLERTAGIRNGMAKLIVQTLADFAKTNLPMCKKVEAVISRFNQDADGFAMRDFDKENVRPVQSRV